MGIINTNPVLINEEVSRIDCKAIAGIGYAFRMKIFYKNSGKCEEWHTSNETKSITVGFTGEFDLKTIDGILEGAEVQLGMNVAAGPDREGNEKFIYKSASSQRAYYEATGPCTNAALRYIGVKSI